MNTPLVSVLISVYNCESTLRRAFDSIIKQTYTNFELIIIVEHGCTDNTLSICMEYAEKNNKIMVYENEKRIGLAASLNLGLELCKGKYIARADSDDVNYPLRLAKQVEYMEKKPSVGILGTWCRFVSENDEWICEHPTDSDSINVALLFNNCLIHSSVMIRADLFNGINWQYPICEAEDYALWSSLILKTQMENLPEVLVDYHIHKGQATSTKESVVRDISVKISRQAFVNELSLDTTSYDDLYFGWRSGGPVSRNVEDFLLNASNLLLNIKAANDRLNRFDKNALFKRLQHHWRETKSIVFMNTLLKDFDEFTKEDINDTIKITDKLRHNFCKVIVYGTGKHSETLIPSFINANMFDIIAFCDSSPHKHGTEFFGKLVISPNSLLEYNFDYVLVATPNYEVEIYKSLINNYNIDINKIWGLPHTEII